MIAKPPDKDDSQLQGDLDVRGVVRVQASTCSSPRLRCNSVLNEEHEGVPVPKQVLGSSKRASGQPQVSKKLRERSESPFVIFLTH